MQFQITITILFTTKKSRLTLSHLRLQCNTFEKDVQLAERVHIGVKVAESPSPATNEEQSTSSQAPTFQTPSAMKHEAVRKPLPCQDSLFYYTAKRRLRK